MNNNHQNINNKAPNYTKLTNNLKIAHLNIQSISSKIDEFSDWIIREHVDIMSINESWLSAGTPLNISSYKVIRKDRASGQTRGGVCLLVHNSLNYKELATPSVFNEECLAVKIENILPNGKDGSSLVL